MLLRPTLKDSIPINVILLMSADTVGASAIKDYIPINVILLMKGACDAGGCIAFSIHSKQIWDFT